MKRNVLIVALCLVLILLSACGTESDGGVVSLEPHSVGTDEASGSVVAGTGGAAQSGNAENGVPVTASNAQGNGSMGMPGNGSIQAGQGVLASGAGTEGQLSVPDGLTDAYCDIYLQKVNENEDNAKVFSLIYLDDDDIPELVVIDRGNDSYSFYTIKNGAIFCMADSMATVEITYFERSGIIAEFDRWNGGGDEGGYGKYYYHVSGEQTITDEAQPLLNFSYNAVYNAEGVYTGEGVTDYYHMGQEIDEVAYREMLNSLGISEDKVRLCAENTYSKEEMINLLNR